MGSSLISNRGPSWVHSTVWGLLALCALSCGDPDRPVDRREHEPAPATAESPSWPGDEEEARRLIEERTIHEPPEPGSGSDSGRLEPSAARIVAAFDRAMRRDALVVGWAPIAEALSSPRVVVFGVTHDARVQHAAFRRLFGALTSPRAYLLELFDADGGWVDLSPEDRRGDDAALASYLATGDDAALRDVRARLVRGAYTAWKYDLVDEVLALLISARGLERDVRGCDAPPRVQGRMEGWAEPTRLRMRELHCAEALRRLDGPAAVLIGDAHASPEGLVRFVPAAVAVHAVGGRASDAGIEPDLAAQLRVSAPVLVPLDAGGGAYALLLPGRHLGIDVDRARVRERRPGLRVEGAADRVAWLDGEELAEGGRGLGAGDHTLVFEWTEPAGQTPETGTETGGPAEGPTTAARTRTRIVVGLSVGEEDGVDVDLGEDLSRLSLRFYSSRAAPPGSER